MSEPDAVETPRAATSNDCITEILLVSDNEDLVNNERRIAIVDIWHICRIVQLEWAPTDGRIYGEEEAALDLYGVACMLVWFIPKIRKLLDDDRSKADDIIDWLSCHILLTVAVHPFRSTADFTAQLNDGLALCIKNVSFERRPDVVKRLLLAVVDVCHDMSEGCPTSISFESSTDIILRAPTPFIDSDVTFAYPLRPLLDTPTQQALFAGAILDALSTHPTLMHCSSDAHTTGLVALLLRTSVEAPHYFKCKVLTFVSSIIHADIECLGVDIPPIFVYHCVHYVQFIVQHKADTVVDGRQTDEIVAAIEECCNQMQRAVDGEAAACAMLCMERVDELLTDTLSLHASLDDCSMWHAPLAHVMTALTMVMKHHLTVSVRKADPLLSSVYSSAINNVLQYHTECMGRGHHHHSSDVLLIARMSGMLSTRDRSVASILRDWIVPIMDKTDMDDAEAVLSTLEHVCVLCHCCVSMEEDDTLLPILLTAVTSGVAHKAMHCLSPSADDVYHSIVRCVMQIGVHVYETTRKRSDKNEKTLNLALAYAALPLLHYGLDKQLSPYPVLMTMSSVFDRWAVVLAADAQLRARSLYTVVNIDAITWRTAVYYWISKGITDNCLLVEKTCLKCLPYTILHMAHDSHKVQCLNNVIEFHLAEKVTASIANDDMNRLATLLRTITHCLCVVSGNAETHRQYAFWSDICASCVDMEIATSRPEMPSQMTTVFDELGKLAESTDGARTEKGQRTSNELRTATCDLLRVLVSHTSMSTAERGKVKPLIIMAITWLSAEKGSEAMHTALRHLIGHALHRHMTEPEYGLEFQMQLGAMPDNTTAEIRRLVELISSVFTSNAHLVATDEELTEVLIVRLVLLVTFSLRVPANHKFDVGAEVDVIRIARRQIVRLRDIFELSDVQFFDQFASTITKFMCRSFCDEIDKEEEDILYVRLVLNRLALLFPLDGASLEQWVARNGGIFVAQLMIISREEASRIHTCLCRLMNVDKRGSIDRSFDEIMLCFTLSSLQDRTRWRQFKEFIVSEATVDGHAVPTMSTFISTCHLRCIAKLVSHLSRSEQPVENMLMWITDSMRPQSTAEDVDPSLDWDPLLRRMLFGLLLSMHQQIVEPGTSMQQRCVIVDSLTLLYSGKLTDKELTRDSAVKVMMVLHACGEMASKRANHESFVLRRFTHSIGQAWYALVTSLKVVDLGRLLPQLVPNMINVGEEEGIVAAFAHIFESKRVELARDCVHWEHLAYVLAGTHAALKKYTPKSLDKWPTGRQVVACVTLVRLEHQHLTALCVDKLHALLSTADGQKYISDAFTDGGYSKEGAVIGKCLSALTRVVHSSHAEEAVVVRCIATIGAIGAIETARLTLCADERALDSNGRLSACLAQGVVSAEFDDAGVSRRYGVHVLRRQCQQLMANSSVHDHDRCQCAVQFTLKAIGITKKTDTGTTDGRALEIWKTLTQSERALLRPMIGTSFLPPTKDVDVSSLPLCDRQTTHDGWVVAVIKRHIRVMGRLGESQKKKHLTRACSLFGALVTFASIGPSPNASSFAVDLLAQVCCTLINSGVVDGCVVDEMIVEWTHVLRRVVEGDTNSYTLNCALTVFRCVDVVRMHHMTLSQAEKTRSPTQLRAMELCAKLLSAIDAVRVDDASSLCVLAAMRCKAYARALYGQHTFIASTATVDAQQFDILEQICAHLYERDDVGGALECITRIRAPTDAERIISLEATGNYNDALPFHEAIVDRRSADVAPNISLSHCLLKLNQAHVVEKYLKGLPEAEEDGDDQLRAARVDASIRLQNWEGLRECVDAVRPSSSPSFEVAVGGALSSIETRVRQMTAMNNEPIEGEEEITSWMYKARVALIAPFKQATIHANITYERSMHALHEMEMAYSYIKNGRSADRLVAEWTRRMALVASTSSTIHPLLETRRALVSMLPPSSASAAKVAQLQHSMWLDAAKIARVEDHKQSAWALLVKARQFDDNSVECSVEEARIHWSKGEQREAIACLNGIHTQYGAPSEASVRHKELADVLTKAYGLRASYSAQAHDSDNATILAMHAELSSNYPCERTVYEAACFSDNLMTKTNNHAMAPSVIKLYRSALEFGSSYVHHAMPRMLTIWLERTDEGAEAEVVPQPSSSTSVTQPTAGGTSYTTVAAHCHELMVTAASSIGAYQYYSVISLLLSRVTHSNASTVALLQLMISRLVVEYPHQCLWQMVPFVSAKIAKPAPTEGHGKRVDLVWEGAIRPVLEENKEINRLLTNMTLLGDAMAKFAEHKEPATKNGHLAQKMDMSSKHGKLYNFFKWDDQQAHTMAYEAERKRNAVGKGRKRGDKSTSTGTAQMSPIAQKDRSGANSGGLSLNIVIPIRKQLEAVMPHQTHHSMASNVLQMSQGPTGTTQVGDTQRTRGHIAFDANVYIRSFKKEVKIYTTLQQPKAIEVLCSDGQTYMLMCKQGDDLRLDKRLQEFNTVVNECLRQSNPSRVRRLHVRTFEVTILREKAGIIEFVPHHRSLTTCIHNTLRQMQREREAMATMPAIAKLSRPADNASAVQKFNEYRSAQEKNPPAMAEYLARTYTEPCGWVQARQNYVRTTAVMCMIGYAVGLGDRHGENILIDEQTAQVLHVDFNMLFDRSWMLKVPEIVPFRLTRQIVDGFGATGVEGSFRLACEATMNVLRINRPMLLTVLHTFLYDPCVEWEVAQDDRRPSKDGKTAKTSVVPPSQNQRIVQVTLETPKRTNREAGAKLAICDRKLQGGIIVNKRSSGQTESVSVAAQVNTLIEYARDDEAVCQMYWGWAPYL